MRTLHYENLYIGDLHEVSFDHRWVCTIDINTELHEQAPDLFLFISLSIAIDALIDVSHIKEIEPEMCLLEQRLDTMPYIDSSLWFVKDEQEETLQVTCPIFKTAKGIILK
ncbi:hypothetical protein [Litoribrevibacter albus]|uniref:Uncharacterized protein n=1 Tax=Litoribrevibacter albus TaxID=1473156 RepID=A0AA37S7R0_9GAMM|nr:hypothetical protein [Litoribrevibacter albus]GLQ29975.1 hypothetical protein GCM10007876_04530 [Litoribrevibacter albus]